MSESELKLKSRKDVETAVCCSESNSNLESLIGDFCLSFNENTSGSKNTPHLKK